MDSLELFKFLIVFDPVFTFHPVELDGYFTGEKGLGAPRQRFSVFVPGFPSNAT